MVDMTADREIIAIPMNAPGKRFGDALAIQEGAVNPTAIARSLVAALYELSGTDTAKRTSDPAVRLILHQLCYICHVGEIDGDAGDTYRKLTDACKKGVSDG